MKPQTRICVHCLWDTAIQSIVSLREKFLHRYLNVPQIPEDPENQADENNDRPREDEEIPETEGSKDAEEEEDEACCIQEDGNEEK